MSELHHEAEWFYVGHYGQLGPLTIEQMKELVRDGVIERDTFVWQSGMSSWVQAETVGPFRSDMPSMAAQMMPPPTPSAKSGAVLPPQPPEPNPQASMFTGASAQAYAPAPPRSVQHQPPQQHHYGYQSLPKSDKSRLVAGLLNFLPGIGRFYLGYAAHGVLQMFVTFITCGVGYIWPVLDSVYILSGGVKLDGYGRRLED